MMNQTAEDIAIEKGKLLNSQMFRPIQISDVTSQRLAFYLKKKIKFQEMLTSYRCSKQSVELQGKVIEDLRPFFVRISY